MRLGQAELRSDPYALGRLIVLRRQGRGGLREAYEISVKDCFYFSEYRGPKTNGNKRLVAWKERVMQLTNLDTNIPGPERWTLLAGGRGLRTIVKSQLRAPELAKLRRRSTQDTFWSGVLGIPSYLKYRRNRIL